MSDAYRRVTVTLPENLADAADRLAHSLDRSRSWVVAEALRRLASEGGVGSEDIPAPDGSRLARLPADMARSPEERVVAGERMAAEAAGQAPGAGVQLLAFRSYQAYLMWDARTGGRP